MGPGWTDRQGVAPAPCKKIYEVLRRNESQPIGRPRTTECAEEHRGPCRKCAAERARRYRSAHGSSAPRYVGESPARARLLLHQRSELGAARRYVLSYLARGAIAPPYGCDRCGVLYGDPRRSWLFTEPRGVLVPFHQAPRATTIRINPRVVVWLCPPCRKETRSAGGVIAQHWRWDAATAPRRHRGVLGLDAPSHAQAAAAARLAPSGQQSRAYCETYLSAIRAPEAWLARVLRDPTFSPTGQATFDAAWRAFAASWWDRRRREAHSDEPLGFIRILSLRERPVRETATVAPWSTSAPTGPRLVAPYDEAAQVAALESAEAVFDRRISEITARLETGTFRSSSLAVDVD